MQLYTAKDFSHLQNIGSISNAAMQMHFKLYEGYVVNVNTIIQKLETIRKESLYTEKLQEFNELHRRLGWEFNGMRLHEIFFGSLKNEPNTDESLKEIKDLTVYNKIVEDFGSFAAWKEDFCNIAKMRGFGWTMLVLDSATGRLMNTWVNEHDGGVLATCKILLVVDMLEHAYITDFGTNRAAYLDSIFTHLDFDKVENLFIR